MENPFISICPPRASSKLVGWPSTLFSACPIGRLRSTPEPLPIKTKSPPPGLFQRWDPRIARYDSRVLAPGARRRTHTAGTTEASLLSLLDVRNHPSKIPNEAIESQLANC